MKRAKVFPPPDDPNVWTNAQGVVAYGFGHCDCDAKFELVMSQSGKRIAIHCPRCKKTEATKGTP